MSKPQATLLGFGAVLFWALLALLTVKTTPVPPFQLTALTFGIGGALGIGAVLAMGEGASLLRTSWKIYVFGTAGLFGYHFFYFTALRTAPAAEAGLIAYLWPLLIVLLSGCLPEETLKRGHVFGALIGFSGAALIVTQGGANFDPGASLGYGLALLCAITWAGYSVLSRRLGDTPTSSVAIFCLATAALSFVAHLNLEETTWPVEKVGWAALIILGVGPVGLAFFVWDIGVKHGNIQLLGVASYAAPLLSTLALILAGVAAVSWTILVAGLLITSGAFLAAHADRIDQ